MLDFGSKNEEVIKRHVERGRICTGKNHSQYSKTLWATGRKTTHFLFLCNVEFADSFFKVGALELTMMAGATFK